MAFAPRTVASRTSTWRSSCTPSVADVHRVLGQTYRTNYVSASVDAGAKVPVMGGAAGHLRHGLRGGAVSWWRHMVRRTRDARVTPAWATDGVRSQVGSEARHRGAKLVTQGGAAGVRKPNGMAQDHMRHVTENWPKTARESAEGVKCPVRKVCWCPTPGIAVGVENQTIRIDEGCEMDFFHISACSFGWWLVADAERKVPLAGGW
jgi:hypothetical protein